jgi:hypothetical protein
MRYTLWHRDTLVGETDFGFGLRNGSRAGVLHPTLPGMAVLPALTAMAPALFAVDDAMKRLPLTDEDIERDVDGAIEAFTSSPEGQRVLRAAEQMAALELRDPSGRPVPFDSILVSDIHEMAALGAALRPDRAGGSDPVRYVISATFSARRGADMAALRPQ